MEQREFEMSYDRNCNNHPLIKEILKKWCQLKLLPLDLWPWAHLFPRKAQMVQKLIIVFIENWKEKEPWFWLI